jgi:putative NADH-flavin reductase
VGKNKPMKTIALFGGTGGTGRLFLEQALDKGYRIKALVRTPAKLNLQHDRLAVIQGDVLIPDEVQQTVQGNDLVVSLFGHVKGSPQWLQTDGTQNIVQAVKQHQVERIISLSGGGLPYPERDQPKFADHLIRGIMKIAVPRILNDAIRHHKVLEDSGLKWTIVRGPRLTDGPQTNDYRVGWVGVNASTKISRADLADFIVTLIEDEQYDYQMPFVSQ